LAEVKFPKIAIVGGESLIGREISEQLSSISPQPATVLISGETQSTRITRDDEGEALILSPMSQESFRGVTAIVLAGTAESSVRALEITNSSNTPLVDLTGALEDQGSARLRAPIFESAEQANEYNINVIAHPAAISLAIFFDRIHRRWPIQRSLVEIFEPASERGQRGLHELQGQTVSLLSFKPLPKDVFDTQLGFNLLPAYGTEAPENLENFEVRIDRHLATLLLLSSRAPMPSLRLIQAPVFHGYSCSIWVEFETLPETEDLAGALASAQVEVRTGDEEVPTNVGVAGQSGLSIGNIRPDRNHPRACWFWMVTDNVRTYADTAVTVLKEYL
jgi:aspartate-semialdehyde dehydrogenase